MAPVLMPPGPREPRPPKVDVPEPRQCHHLFVLARICAECARWLAEIRDA